MLIQVYLGDLIIKKSGKFTAKGSIFPLFCIISIHQSLLKLVWNRSLSRNKEISALLTPVSETTLCSFFSVEWKPSVKYSKLSLLLSELEIRVEQNSGWIWNGFWWVFLLLLLASFTSCLRSSEQLKVSYLWLPGGILQSKQLTYFLSFLRPSYLIRQISSGWGEPTLIGSCTLYWQLSAARDKWKLRVEKRSVNLFHSQFRLIFGLSNFTKHCTSFLCLLGQQRHTITSSVAKSGAQVQALHKSLRQSACVLLISSNSFCRWPKGQQTVLGASLSCWDHPEK